MPFKWRYNIFGKIFNLQNMSVHPTFRLAVLPGIMSVSTYKSAVSIYIMTIATCTSTFYWSACTKSEKWTVIFVCYGYRFWYLILELFRQCGIVCFSLFHLTFFFHSISINKYCFLFWWYTNKANLSCWTWPHQWRNGQTKDSNIGICCFSAKYAALRRKSKHWLARNQDNVSIRRLLFLWSSTIKMVCVASPLSMQH